jgi:hypothetical protein
LSQTLLNCVKGAGALFVQTQATEPSHVQSFFRTLEPGTSDDELVGQAKSGDRPALEKLVLRHQAWIYNIAVRMVFDPHDAEEVTQEVLIKVITRLSTFQGESKFRTWLYSFRRTGRPSAR